MPIFFKNQVHFHQSVSKVAEEQPLQSFADIKERVARKLVDTKPSINVEDNNSGYIKPKYLEDKSVFYKSSGYLKDLLGEGN